MTLTEIPAALHKIADLWGGKDCPRRFLSTFFRFGVAGDRYNVFLPGTEAFLAEDDGRPFTMIVPQGKYLVRCLTDAPDCWWYTDLNGDRDQGRI